MTVDVWVPLGFASASAPPRWKMRGFRTFSIIGRLKSGVGLSQARDDAAQTARWLEQTYPRFNGQTGVIVTPLAERLTGAIRPALLMLFAAVGLVLLVACANLANLSLARSAARMREIAIRIALGANRRHLVVQFTAESAVLAAAGAAAGLLFAWWCRQALIGLHPAGLPRLDEIRLDTPVLVFTMTVSVLVTLLFGAVPGIAAARRDTAGALGDARTASSRGIRRLHAGLIVVEIAVSVTLLIGGALLSRSLIALVQTDIGVSRGNVLTMKLTLGSAALVRPPTQAAFLTRVLSSVGTQPGVRSAGLSSSLPPSVSQMHMSFSTPNRLTGGTNESAVEIVAASQDTFATLGIPLVAGRVFTAADSDGARHVLVLGTKAAQRLFPEGDAIGHALPVGSSEPGVPDPEVVGIVGDVKYSGLDAAPDGAIYMPYGQRAFGSTYLVVRTAADPVAVASSVRQAILMLEPTVGISDIRPLERVVSDAVAQPRFRMWLLLLLAGLAAAMAAVGLYGVIEYGVSQRHSEIGVRIALGATSTSVLLMILRQGLALIAMGLVVGIATAYGLSRTLAAFLYGVGVTDMVSFASAAAFIIVVGVMATLIPAGRAAAVDPMVVLRNS